MKKRVISKYFLKTVHRFAQIEGINTVPHINYVRDYLWKSVLFYESRPSYGLDEYLCANLVESGVIYYIRGSDE